MTPNQRALFLDLVSRHESQVFGYLFALVRNMDNAEDLYQQTLLTAWEKFDQFEAGTNFNAWVTQIARYKALNFLQSQQHSRLVFSDVLVNLLAERQTAEEPTEREDRKRALEACMRKLREADYELIEACYGGDTPIHEVAKRLGRSVAGVFNSLCRIRSRLFICIQRELALEP